MLHWCSSPKAIVMSWADYGPGKRRGMRAESDILPYQTHYTKRLCYCCFTHITNIVNSSYQQFIVFIKQCCFNCCRKSVYAVVGEREGFIFAGVLKTAGRDDSFSVDICYLIILTMKSFGKGMVSWCDLIRRWRRDV